MNVGNSLRKESKRDVTPVISIRGYRRGVVAYLFFSGTPTAYYQHLSFQPYAFFFATTRPRGANGRQKLFIMKRFLFVLAAMSLLFTACEDGSDDYIKLKEVDDVCTMMDDLELMEFCYEEFDVNKDGKVSMEEAAAVREFDTWTYDISSIKGIEYFPNIEVLDISFAYLTECNLMNNKKLKSISLGLTKHYVMSNVSDLNFSKHTNLSYVILRNVAVKNLNLANGNDVEVDLRWDHEDTPPSCTIWLKAGQVLDVTSMIQSNTSGNFIVNNNYTIKYVD